MVKIIGLDVQLTGLSILEVHDYFDLTTSESENYELSPRDGGIQIYPEMDVLDVPHGNVYVLQVIKNHFFRVLTQGGDEHLFKSTNPLRDSKNPSNVYNQKLIIKGSKFVTAGGFDETDFLYRDSPFVELKRWFKIVEYDIDFETIYFYRESDRPLNAEITGSDMKSLLSFQWSLSAIAQNTSGQWDLKSSTSRIKHHLDTKTGSNLGSYTFEEISSMTWIRDEAGDFLRSIHRDPSGNQ